MSQVSLPPRDPGDQTMMPRVARDPQDAKLPGGRAGT